jgi:hypothetical protein
LEVTSRHPSVGPVVSWARDDGNPSTIDPAKHPDCFPSYRSSGSIDQNLDRLRRAGIDRRHLSRGYDWDHDARATTIA